MQGIYYQYSSDLKQSQKDRDEAVVKEAIAGYTRKRGQAPGAIAVHPASTVTQTALPAGVRLDRTKWIQPGCAVAMGE